MRKSYLTDLTDAQWEIVRSAMKPAKNGRTGTPRRYPLREMWNAILYQTRTGVAWRALPPDFPPWPAVWQQFQRWQDNGTLEAVHEALRVGVCKKEDRSFEPGAAILASHLARMTIRRGAVATSTPRRRSPHPSDTFSSAPSD
jgi:transposase